MPCNRSAQTALSSLRLINAQTGNAHIDKLKYKGCHIRFFESYSLEFWLGLLIGIIATGLYSFDSFRKPSELESPERPETKFPPNELTSEGEYLKSFIMYFLGLEIVYVLFCFLGPEVVSGGILNPAESNSSVVDKDTFPLWVALVMIGILPRIPILSFMEESWRKLMHRRAMIPKGVQRIARELRGTNISFDADFRQKVREKKRTVCSACH